MIGVLAGLGLASGGCGSAGAGAGKVICKPVPSFASPAVQCMAVATPKPPPAPKPRPEPEPEPPPEPEPEKPPPVVVKQEAIELDRTVQFEPDSAKLIDDSRTLLDEVAKALEEHPEIKLLQIEGHTDSRMSTRHNKKLSVQRAAAVRAYLIEKGIAKDRLTAEGFGETKPIADNATWKGRFQNRRVDLKITKRDDAGADSGDDGKPAKAHKGGKAKPDDGGDGGDGGDTKPTKRGKGSKATTGGEAAEDAAAEGDDDGDSTPTKPAKPAKATKKKPKGGKTDQGGAQDE